jgi:hypothetical protein
MAHGPCDLYVCLGASCGMLCPYGVAGPCALCLAAFPASTAYEHILATGGLCVLHSLKTLCRLKTQLRFADCVRVCVQRGCMVLCVLTRIRHAGIVKQQ